MPLFTTILSLKIVFSCTNKGPIKDADPPARPPTQTLPPPQGGRGHLVWGPIAPNQPNPPTHRPQTHPPHPPTPWGGTTLKQRSGPVIRNSRRAVVWNTTSPRQGREYMGMQVSFAEDMVLQEKFEDTKIWWYDDAQHILRGLVTRCQNPIHASLAGFCITGHPQ